MDDYLFAMLLAEDVMKCVFKMHEIEWNAKNSFRPVYKGKFPERIVTLSMEKAVIMFINTNPKPINAIIKDYTKNNSPTVCEFGQYAIEFGSEVFKDGFDPEDFIKYSAIIAELAYRLYDHCQDIPTQAVGVIGTVFISQIMTQQFEESGGQKGLKESSFKLLKQLNNLKLELKKQL